MDPNQTAMALLSVTSSHGRGFGAIAIAFSMEGMYGDGMNLYQYLGSNPWMRFDPLGLSFDDDIEALIDELTGGRAAALSQLGKDVEASAIVAARIMSMLPIPFAGLAGDLALYALGDQSGGELAAALALGIIPGGKLGGKLFKSIGGVAGSAFSASAQMARAGGTRLLHGANTLAARAAHKVRKLAQSVVKGRCGCFTAATMVWTAQGMVPIAEIEQGQYVYAAQEDAQASDYAPGEVGDTIYLGEASLVRLTVRHEDGSYEVIETTDEHPFHPVHTGEWTRADQLQIGDLLSAMHGTAELVAVEYGTDRVPVYNLSIPTSPTYYVGEHGVWVHNCGAGLHHLIPMYLGGAKSGKRTSHLNSTQHSRLHVLINQAGASRGIPKHSGPGNGTKGVDRWARDIGPETADLKIREALIEAYQKFDAEQGTSLFPDMYRELLGGPIR